jgi:predicted RNA-binding Zn ribbon-like protein
MSKLQEAPGELEQVRAFVNTLDLEQGSDELDSPSALASWLTDRKLLEPSTEAGPGDLSRAIDLREALRALMLANNGELPVPAGAAAILDGAVMRARVQLRFDEGCAGALRPAAAGVDAALGRLLAVVHEASADGTWQRLKACREHSCEWAFYDHTKNRSGAWCNMAVCGNRAKARAYRERRGTASPG